MRNHSEMKLLPWARQEFALSLLLALLVVGSVIVGIFSYSKVRHFVAHTNLPILPSTASVPAELPAADPALPTPQPVATPQPGALPLEQPDEAEPPPPAAQQRMTILIMGIDRREGEEGPWRTDSMIVVSLDPESNSVAMLSVPRDLFVTLPDYGYGERLDRINTAYYYGDLEGYPGGGPALAKQSFRRNFGIEIDRYLVMDFNGFRQVIDQIGGIQVDVPEPIVDYEYPTEDYGIMTVRFEDGPQQMDGERALIYSRTRKSTSDFARAERQQQVILAVRDRVLSLNIIPSLTPAKLARLLATVDQSIRTDLTLDETLALAQAARSVDSDNISRLVVDQTMVTDYLTDAGAQVLLPRWDLILPATEALFSGEVAAVRPANATPTVGSNRTALPEFDSDTRVVLWNGTEQRGLATRTAARLQEVGFNVTSVGDAERSNYRQSTIHVYSSRALPTAQALQRFLALPAASIVRHDGAGEADIVVILGQDQGASSGGGGRP